MALPAAPLRRQFGRPWSATERHAPFRLLARTHACQGGRDRTKEGAKAAIDRSRNGSTGSAKVAHFLTAADSLDEFIGISGAKLVFVDTLTNATRRDLCRQDEVGPLLAPLQGIAQRHEIAPILLQHVSREGQALGRRSKGLTRTLIHLACPDPDQPARLRLWVEKSFAVRPSELGVTMGAEGNEYDKEPPAPRELSHGGRPPAKRDKVREFIKDALTSQNDRIGNELCGVQVLG